MTRYRVAAVDRALRILDRFEGGAERFTLAALNARTGLCKSTILRLAGSLGAAGYLARWPDGAFALGPAAARLGSRSERSKTARAQ